MIAKRILSRFDAPTEAQECVLSTLFSFFSKGHLALDASEQGLDFLTKELAIEDKEAFQRLFLEGLSSCFQDKFGVNWVVATPPFYAFPKQYKLEQEIVSHLRRLSSATPFLLLPPPYANPSLNPEQQLAVNLAMQFSVSLITGGPGTGKSFTAKALIDACSCIADLSVVIAAPTGKAASHLSSRFSPSLSLQSGTIHSFLGKPLCADIILIDECSMIDAELFLRLLESIPSGCRLVLIGDKEQLPPVESGSIFADLIDYSDLPCTSLKHSHRSSSEILELAKAMIQGDEMGAFTLLQAAGLWIDLDTTPLLPLLLKERSSGGSEEVILSCMRRGPLGADAINAALYEQALSRAPLGSILSVPLLVTANHHDIKLYNGDQGVLLLKPEDPSSSTVLFSLPTSRTVPLSALSSYSYNYALSIHKSQGSEYEEVLIVAPEGSEIFGREVLYTAVTRAKKRVRIASTRAQLTQILHRSSRKISALSHKLTI